MVPWEAPRDPKRAPESMKNLKKMMSISKSIFESHCFMVSDGFLMDFDEKRSQNLHVFNKV